MTVTRATTYVGIASVLSAWLAAAGVSVAPGSPQPKPRPADAAAQALARDVQAQASRLRTRLSAAPAPHEPFRNPFAFAPRERARAAGVKGAAPIAPVPAAIPEPPLTLAGLAERETPAGVVRTAMITSDSDELFMLAEGDTLGGRYRVKSIAAETVELTDLVTGATRRLTLR